VPKQNKTRFDAETTGFQPAPVFNRLLDEEAFTGVYAKRFEDFDDNGRKSFSRMQNVRGEQKMADQTARRKFKGALRRYLHSD
jgi:hypothetical protein